MIPERWSRMIRVAIRECVKALLVRYVIPFPMFCVGPCGSANMNFFQLLSVGKKSF